MAFTVYILRSASLLKYYIGHTGDDMTGLLRKHLSDHSGFTSTAKDRVVVYTEIFGTREEAYRREREIKGRKSKRMIEKLILGHSAASSEHPDL